MTLRDLHSTYCTLYAATGVWSVAAASLQGASRCHLPIRVAFQSILCESSIQALSGQVAPQRCTANVIRRRATPCVPAFRQCATGHPVAVHLAKHLCWQRRVNSGPRTVWQQGRDAASPPRLGAARGRPAGGRRASWPPTTPADSVSPCACVSPTATGGGRRPPPTRLPSSAVGCHRPLRARVPLPAKGRRARRCGCAPEWCPASVPPARGACL